MRGAAVRDRRVRAGARLGVWVLLASLLVPLQVLADAAPAHAAVRDGVLLGMGSDYEGTLGDGTVGNPDYGNPPTEVAGLSDVVQVAVAGGHTLALRADGRVWSWGDDTRGQVGDGTVGTPDLDGVPNEVIDLTDVVQVSAGDFFSLALRADGTVWAFGWDNLGQLGGGDAVTPVEQPVPQQVVGLTNVVEIAAGAGHGLALRSDGSVWAWGHDGEGQLGDREVGNPVVVRTPAPVVGLTDVTHVAAGGNHSLAVRADGTLWAWGRDVDGELGDGTVGSPDNVAYPTRVQGLTGVVDAAAGRSHSVALRSDGTVWAFGNDTNGQLGDGVIQSPTDDPVPGPVQGLADVVAIDATWSNTFAVRGDGTAWAMGQIGGQAGGVGGVTPAPVPDLTGVQQVASDGYTTFVLSAPTVAVSTTALDLGGQPVGTTSPAQTVTVTNTGMVEVFGPVATVEGYRADEFPIVADTCATVVLAAGQSCQVDVAVSPSGTGWRSATLSLTDNAVSSPQHVLLSGEGTDPGLRLDLTSLDFGDQRTWTAATHQVTVTSTGTTPVTVSAASLSGSEAGDFFVDGPSLPATLAPGQSLPVSITYLPPAERPARATLTLTTDTRTGTHTVDLLGRGVAPALAVTPSSLTFPAVRVGSSSDAQQVVFRNDGTASLALDAIVVAGANAGDFTITSSLCGTILSAGAQCPAWVAFTPEASGPRQAALAVRSSDLLAPVTIPLAGDADNPVATLSTSAVDFGEQRVGPSSTWGLWVRNDGVGPLEIGALRISGNTPGSFTLGASDCEGASLAEGDVCTVQVSLSAAAEGPLDAVLEVVDNAGDSPQQVALHGVGVRPAAGFSPAPLDLGGQLVGTSTTRSVTVTNTGTGTMQVGSVSVPDGPFSVELPALPVFLRGGESLAVPVTFAPGATGPMAADLSVAVDTAWDGAFVTRTVALSGAGVAPSVEVSPGSLTFGTQPVGSTGPASRVAVANTGDAPLTVSDVTAAGAFPGDFTVAANTCVAPVAPGGGCSVWVAFAPSGTGVRSGELVLSTDDPGRGRVSVSLAGSGVSDGGPGPHRLAVADEGRVRRPGDGVLDGVERRPGRRGRGDPGCAGAGGHESGVGVDAGGIVRCCGGVRPAGAPRGIVGDGHDPAGRDGGGRGDGGVVGVGGRAGRRSRPDRQRADPERDGGGRAADRDLPARHPHPHATGAGGRSAATDPRRAP